MSQSDRLKAAWSLGIIWLCGAIADRLWFAIDRAVPSWDPADYLTGALNYWNALQHPHWFSSQWWTQLWLLSSKIPPLTYLSTVPILNLFGTGSDRATLVNLLYSAILLASVYGLGAILFNRTIGVWAAGLCLLFPGLYRVRLDFLLDYPLTTAVTLAFFCLTAWRFAQTRRSRWLWAIAFGASVGVALMVKQTAVLFLVVPITWVAATAIRHRHWQRLGQLLLALCLSLPIWVPWYRTNWLIVLTASKRATVDSAIAEGDPPLHTLAAWTFYPGLLPHHVSIPLLLVPIVGLLLWLVKRRFKGLRANVALPNADGQTLRWLAIFWVGAYVFCSLNINKDFRYVLPYLPVVALFLAYGFQIWQGRWGMGVRWGTVGIAIALGVANLAPTTNPTPARSLTAHPAYVGVPFPHRDVIAAIVEAQPYRRSTLGVLPSTPTLNQHNVNYYGALAEFRVYGRQVGVDLDNVAQDARSLGWFLTKTGNQGSVPTEAQTAMVQTVERGGQFQLHRSWTLPDRSTLNLYRRRDPFVTVRSTGEMSESAPLQLQVSVPPRVPPGHPVPVNYQWTGSWGQLQPGLVLLSWQRQDTGRLAWLHDRAIAKGTLLDRPNSPADAAQFAVSERTAMFPPQNTAAGTYTLAATYLNRETGETAPVNLSPTTIQIDPNAAPVPAPELDWVTQLRQFAKVLPQGIDAIAPVFEEIGRINQYDPIQDYTVQAEKMLEYRLQQNPNRVELAYALGLANVLQKDADGAISAFETVAKLDTNNPYAHAYLAFVNLYDFHPNAAKTALKPAFEIAPDLPELKVLRGIASLMQGNLIGAWQDSQPLREGKL